jgi:hypothetical protein
MDLSKNQKEFSVVPTRGLYKWARVFNRLQRKFFVEETQLRRERQIEDFVKLNGFNQVHLIVDTDVLASLTPVHCSDIAQADIVIITDQKFSRLPCTAMLAQIDALLQQVPNLYLCLNRHYINIDNTYYDLGLSANFNIAITQWLKQNLSHQVIYLSLDYLDVGRSFTWALPDRHYYISRQQCLN